MHGHLVRAMVRLHVPKQTLKAHLHTPSLDASLFLSLVCFPLVSRLKTFPFCADVFVVVIVAFDGVVVAYSGRYRSANSATAAAFAAAAPVVVALFPDYFCNCCLSCWWLHHIAFAFIYPLS